MDEPCLFGGESRCVDTDGDGPPSSTMQCAGGKGNADAFAVESLVHLFKDRKVTWRRNPLSYPLHAFFANWLAPNLREARDWNIFIDTDADKNMLRWLWRAVTYPREKIDGLREFVVGRVHKSGSIALQKGYSHEEVRSGGAA